MMGRSPASCAASDSLRSNASNNNVHRPQPAEAAICIWNMLSECLKHNPKCSCQRHSGSESIFVGKQTSGELKIRHKLELLQVVHRAIAFVNHEKLWPQPRTKPGSRKHVIYAAPRPHFGYRCAVCWTVLRRHSLTRGLTMSRQQHSPGTPRRRLGNGFSASGNCVGSNVTAIPQPGWNL
jgi:hypothetical protein